MTYITKNTWQIHHPYHAEWRKPFPLTSRIRQGCQPLAHLFKTVGKSWSEKLGKKRNEGYILINRNDGSEHIAQHLRAFAVLWVSILNNNKVANNHPSSGLHENWTHMVRLLSGKCPYMHIKEIFKSETH